MIRSINIITADDKDNISLLRGTAVISIQPVAQMM